MANETKRTAILDFQIEQGDALRELEATKKSILQLKQEQKELNDAYKAGLISVDKYAAEQVKLDATLKKQSSTYNNVQRSITGLKNPIEQLTKSTNKLSESIKDQAKQVTVAGVSLQNFVNPVTGTIAVLGLLFRAYSSSSFGAKDLEFATNQLSAAFGILGNELASLAGSKGEDGKGFFSSLSDFGLRLLDTFGAPGRGLGSKLADAGKEFALLQEQFQQLNRDLAIVQGDNNERLSENSELLEKVADSQTAYAEKIHLTGEAISNIRKNEEALLGIKQKELQLLESQVGTQVDQEKLQGSIGEKTKEISRIQADAKRKVSAIQKLESNLLDTENKKAEAATKTADANERTLEAKKKQKDIDDLEGIEKAIEKTKNPFSSISDTTLGKTGADSEDFLARGVDKATESLSKLTAATQKGANVKTVNNKLDKEQIQNLLVLSSISGLLAGAFEANSVEYKAFSISKAIVDTYLAATAALAPPPEGIGPLFGPILAATTIAAGLANVTRIAAAAGGGTFHTKGPQLLLVGDNPGGVERVEVTPLSGRGKTRVAGNMTQMGGGGTMIADGGVSKDAMTRGVNQKMMMPNIQVINQWRDFVDFSDKKAIQSKWAEV